MAEKKKSWDEIPSLDELKMDWDYKADTTLGKRKHERMTNQDVASLFGKKTIRARVATDKQTIDGTLSDICAGGMALILNREFSVNQYVKIGLFLGKQKIVSNAVVKRATPVNNSYKVGFQFHNINEEDSRYINSLYASKRLNRL